MYALIFHLKSSVLALGRPGELEPPVGAAQFYVPDDAWEQTIQDIVPLCSAVVWTTGHTRALRWEIEHLVNVLAPQRLLIWLHVGVMKGTQEQRAFEWNKFLADCGAAFRKPLPREVDGIQMIAFDNDWTPMTIPSGPVPLLEFLRKRRKVLSSL